MMLTDQVSSSIVSSFHSNSFSFVIQAIAAPLLNGVILAYIPLVSGKSFSEMKERFREVEQSFSSSRINRFQCLNRIFLQ